MGRSGGKLTPKGVLQHEFDCVTKLFWSFRVLIKILYRLKVYRGGNLSPNSPWIIQCYSVCLVCFKYFCIFLILSYDVIHKINLKLGVHNDIKKIIQAVGIKIRNSSFIYSGLKLNFLKFNDAWKINYFLNYL